MTNKTDNRETEIATLRQELGFYRAFARGELREEIKQWIADARGKDAGSVAEFIRGQLMEMRAAHPMRWSPHLQHGAEGFPDACEGCEHYGKACPVVSDRERVRARERRLSEAQTESAARAVWRDISVQTGCRRIPEWLQEWSTEHEGFVTEGHRLLERAESLTMDASEDMEQLPEHLRSVDADEDDVLALGGVSDD